MTGMKKMNLSLRGMGLPILLLAVGCLWLCFQHVVVEMAVERGGRELREFVKNDNSLIDQNEVESHKVALKAWKEWESVNKGQYENISDYLVKNRDQNLNLRNRLLNEVIKNKELLSNMIVAPAGQEPEYSADEKHELTWTYGKDEKLWPYVGSDRWMDSFPPKTRKYYNSLATFPHANRTRMHGLVGLHPNGTRKWQPIPNPGPIENYPGGKTAALKYGGFYFNLSNALPLDRDPTDGREDICRQVTYDYTKMEDVSVIITFFNEPPSTLLRTVHSILNFTPPPLLREIILVDDHSDLVDDLPGGYLDQYIKLLPKTKILRLPQRRGLVMGRLAGAKLAAAPVFVVLDSHVEMNSGWLEPMLDRLADSPRSVVFPQIMAINTLTFDYSNESGIGAFLSFKWMMQERPYFTGAIKKTDPIPSASMAGGLFAVRRDWFFESGSYDEEFHHWGAENVEMAFRVWMCGGKVECTPCSRTYHIYRNGGAGYSSPSGSLAVNRLRTARIWMDEYYQLAREFTRDGEGDQANLVVGGAKVDRVNLGPLDKMLDFKDRMKCKSFKWFLENVDPTREGQDLNDFGVIGDFRNHKYKTTCLDSLSNKSPGTAYGVYGCHGDLGAQGWFQMKPTNQVHNQQQEYLCMGHKGFKLTECSTSHDENSHWRFENEQVIWDDGKVKECLAIGDKEGGGNTLTYKPCDVNDDATKWSYRFFKPDPHYELPTISPAYRKLHPRHPEVNFVVLQEIQS